MKVYWQPQPDGSWKCGPVTVRLFASQKGDYAMPDRWGMFIADGSPYGKLVCRPGGYHKAHEAKVYAPRIKAVREALGLPLLTKKGEEPIKPDWRLKMLVARLEKKEQPEPDRAPADPHSQRMVRRVKEANPNPPADLEPKPFLVRTDVPLYDKRQINGDPDPQPIEVRHRRAVSVLIGEIRRKLNTLESLVGGT